MRVCVEGCCRFGQDPKGPYGESYTWTVEYQCIETANIQTYVGFNIYHREWNPPQADVDAMKAVVHAAGFSEYWTSGKIKPMGGAHCNYTNR